ncbi:ribonuclease H-like domain-containing protein [Tanacetum coccineum]
MSVRQVWKGKTPLPKSSPTCLNDSPTPPSRNTPHSISPPMNYPQRDQIINQLHTISTLIDSQTPTPTSPLHLLVQPPTNAQVGCHASFCHCCRELVDIVKSRVEYSGSGVGRRGDIPFNYLGLPIGSNMKSIASWKTLVDRFHMRLSSWKANLLSIGGRLTLINAEAKYRGVAIYAIAESCWLRNLLRELHTPLLSATLVYCDNINVVYLSSNMVRVLHVPSRYQYANIFTKSLPSALFEDISYQFDHSISSRSKCGDLWHRYGMPNCTNGLVP